MIVQQTRQLDLAASYSKNVSHERSESLRAWKDSNSMEISSQQGSRGSISAAAQFSLRQGLSESSNRQLPFSLGLPQPAPVQAPPAAIDNAALSGKSAAAEEVADSKTGDDESPEISLIRRLIEMISGKKIEVFSARDLGDSEAGKLMSGDKSLHQAGQEAANWGAIVEARESYEEHEKSSFSASGSVVTADGRSINFQLELSMESYFRQETSVRALFGQATKDPLVINFSGGAAQLTDQFFKFDLDGDGSQEEIPTLASGSGYLFFDRNGDGVANDGRELFGPATNDGFAELAALDADGNGWIDEADPAFAQLGIWRMSPNGDSQYTSLKNAGIGALALAHLATPNNLRSNAMQLLGEVRTSGLALTEDGRALSMQQIDLVVR
ncbi:MAG: VCBS repeat-containing protein [Azonexus sp.]